jgi:AraC-like DNA-binding protein
MELEQKLTLFRDLVTCGGDLFFWTYDDRLHLQVSNSPDNPHAELLDKIFEHSGFQDEIRENSQAGHLPLMLSLTIGLVWYVITEKNDDVVSRYHVIGPVYLSEISFAVIESMINQSYSPEYDLPFKRELIHFMANLPVVSPAIISRFALMLHYIVHGEKLGPSDIVSKTGSAFQMMPDGNSMLDRRRMSQTEETLIRMVREGDLNYKSALDRAASVASGLNYHLKDPLRQAKNSSLIFTALCSRAAVDGGLPGDLAYALSSSYLQSIEICRTVSDVIAVTNTMYEDFIRRVHRNRQRSGLSRPVRDCCEYIDFNVEEKIGITDLARHLGYSEYYLSRLFKKEIGSSINDVIKRTKIIRAQSLLVTTEDSIQDIADRLNFCSRSFFADTFKKVTGETPADFRTRNRRV